MIDFDEYTVGDHRAACPACSKTPRDKSLGITILAHDHGIARCFRCDFVQLRREQRELSPAEKLAYQRRMEALRRQHDAEQRQRHAEVALAAETRWKAAAPADSHPYLFAKGIQPHGARIEAGHTLLVRMSDVHGNIHNVQSIAPDGVKRFMPGGRVKGLYCPIGRPSGRLVVCEGFATGATIHEDSGHAVAVAFNAGNLLAVAKSLRAKFPCITLVIAADDDWKTEGNPGLTAATEAARAVGGLLAVPNFAGLDRGEKDTDFNDLHRLSGSVEVPA